MQTVRSERLMRAAMRSAWLDGLLRMRAKNLLEKTRMHRFLPRHGLLLDLGACFGHLTEAMLKDAPGRTCVALDPVWVPPPPVAGRLAARPCHFVRGDGGRLPFPPACFDGAWLSFVLHHLLPTEQLGVLDEAARVLRPSAAFVLLEDTPASGDEAATTLRADRRLNFEHDKAPHHYRSPDEWRRLLPEHGFKVIEEFSFRRIFPPATLRPVRHSAFLCRRS